MKKILLPLLCLVLYIQLNAQTFNRQWANCYSDSTAATFVNDVATDANGNNYIVGYKTNSGDEYYQTHMFLRKVNASGTEEWIRYFNDAQDSIDNARAVGVDNKGNIYVTGTRIDTFCNICTYRSKISDIVTMKYNPQGQRLWLNRYAPGDYVLSTPSDIFVLASGHSVIAGNEQLYNPVTFVWENRAVITAITPAGITAWVRKIDTTIANSVTADRNGNILVAAAYNPDNTFMTTKPSAIKLSKNGRPLWTKRFNEFNKRGQYYSVFTDSTGNVYLNGQSDTITFNNVPRILTVKLNGSTGDMFWNRKEETFTTTLPHFYGSYAVDNAGNSYVTGYSTHNSVGRDWVITKYNRHGLLEWTNHYAGTSGGDDIPIDIKADANGSVYVAGNTFGPVGGRYSYALNVYNAAGSLQYQNFYRNNASYLIPAGLGLDNAGNVYVSGICTIKYGTNQLATANQEMVTAATGKAVTVFPNPAKELLFFRMNAMANTIGYIISDNTGKTLIQQTTASKTTVVINVQQLKSGTYFIKIMDGKNSFTTKFIKL